MLVVAFERTLLQCAEAFTWFLEMPGTPFLHHFWPEGDCTQQDDDDAHEILASGTEQSPLKRGFAKGRSCNHDVIQVCFEHVRMRQDQGQGVPCRRL